MHKKNKSNRSFVMAGLFLVALVIVVVVSVQVSQTGDRSSFGDMLRQKMDGIGLQLDDAGIRAAQKDVAGFWESVTPASDSTRIRVNDRLELKDNGIIWRVVRYSVLLPSGDTARFTHVLSCYIRPWGSMRGDSGRVSCDSRIIGQVMIHDGDTCYGTTQEDYVWKVQRMDDTLVFEGIRYAPYRGASLDTFFPPRLIGTEIAREYSVGNGFVALAKGTQRKRVSIVDDVHLGECPPGTGVGQFVRDKLVADARARTAPASQAELGRIARWYYAPLLRTDALRNFGEAGSRIGDTVWAHFTVRTDGTVSNARVRSGTVALAKLEAAVASEIAAWKFPFPAEPTSVVCPVVFPAVR